MMLSGVETPALSVIDDHAVATLNRKMAPANQSRGTVLSVLDSPT